MKDVKLDGLSREDWLKIRRSGVGGSDVAGIMKMSPFATPLDVYLDKIGESKPIEENARMIAGRFLEPAVANMFADMFTDYKLVKDTHMRFHKDYPYMFANTDYLIKAPDGSYGVLEIKTTNSWYAKTWTDDVPAQYYLQLMYYIGIMDFQFGYIAILIDGWDFRCYRYERNNNDIQSIFFNVMKFWNDNVIAKVEPEPMSDEDLKTLYPETVSGKCVEADVLVRADCNEYLEVLEEESVLKSKKSKLAFDIKRVMGDAELLIDGDEIIAKLKQNAKGARVLTVVKQN